MLQRYTQVGEYYVMSKPEGLTNTSKGFMDILLYDEESDKFVKISYIDALLSTGCFTATAVQKAAGTITVSAGAPAAGTVIGTNADGSELKFGGDGTTAGYADLAIALAKLNVEGGNGTAAALDAPVILARPFIEHAMLSAILTVSGQDTGATLFGPSDMQISANTSVKTIEGHYTGHFKSVITKPQNVFVMKDIMSNGYRAGCNTKFFSADGSNVAQAVMDRLNMEDTDSDTTHGSLLAFPVSPGQLDSIQTEISVTSRLLPWDVHSTAGNKYFPGGEKMYEFFKTKYGLESVHFGEDLRASENMEYMSQVSSAPEIVPPRTRVLTLPFCLRAGRRQQLAVLQGPLPHLRCTHDQGARDAVPRHGPLGLRRAPWRRESTAFKTNAPSPRLRVRSLINPPCSRSCRPAGAVARPSR